MIWNDLNILNFVMVPENLDTDPDSLPSSSGVCNWGPEWPLQYFETKPDFDNYFNYSKQIKYALQTWKSPALKIRCPCRRIP